MIRSSKSTVSYCSYHLSLPSTSCGIMWIETRLRVCIDRWLTTGSAISLQCPPLDLKALFEDLPRICKAPAVECAAEGTRRDLCRAPGTTWDSKWKCSTSDVSPALYRSKSLGSAAPARTHGPEIRRLGLIDLSVPQNQSDPTAGQRPWKRLCSWAERYPRQTLKSGR